MVTSEEEIHGKTQPAQPVSGLPKYKAGVLLSRLLSYIALFFLKSTTSNLTFVSNHRSHKIHYVACDIFTCIPCKSSYSVPGECSGIKIDPA